MTPLSASRAEISRSRFYRNQEKHLKELITIPGVGRKIALYFLELGIKRVSDLKKKKPQVWYDALCRKQGYRVDRCMLYVFRCSVYYATHKKHDPRKLCWWNWK